MGHTVHSQRMIARMMLDDMKSFGKALRPEEREIYREILLRPLKHVGSLSCSSSIDAWAFILLSIALEQEKRIRKYESLVDGLLQETEQDSDMVQGDE